MTLDDFKPGDMIEITTRWKHGDEVRSALVTMVNYNNLGHVNFGPRYVEGRSKGEAMLPTGQGTFVPGEIGAKPFGIVNVRIVGHKRITNAPFWQPKPGDRGYDPMF